MLQIIKKRRKLHSNGKVVSIQMEIKSDDINYIKRKLNGKQFNEPNCYYIVKFNDQTYTLEAFKQQFNIK